MAELSDVNILEGQITASGWKFNFPSTSGTFALLSDISTPVGVVLTTTDQSISGLKTFTDQLTVTDRLVSERYLLGLDLSLIPVVGGQSVLSSWWGLQIRGNQQSNVDFTPANIGAGNDYGIIAIAPSTPNVSTVMVRTNAGQTIDALQIQNSAGTATSKVDADGNSTFNNVKVSSLATANSGNFTSWNVNNQIVDSGVSLSSLDNRFLNVTGDASTGNFVFSGILAISGSNPISGAELIGYGCINPMSKISEFRDEFLSGSVSSTLGWAGVNSGTGASSQQSTSTYGFNATEKAFGVWNLDTGTNSAGRANINLGTAGILFGLYDLYQKWRVGVNVLSDATNRYGVRIGFINSTTNTEPTNGAYFEYDNATSPNWRICTANNSTRTKTTTTVAVQATSFDRLWIYIPPDASRVDYYINENFVGTITTNIPTASGRNTGVGATIFKTIGSTQRDLFIDYFYMRMIGDRG
jgi:hypothetical protein